MIWREPRDHITHCYVSLSNVVGFTGKSCKLITYLSLNSASRPEHQSLGISNQNLLSLYFRLLTLTANVNQLTKALTQILKAKNKTATIYSCPA